MFNPNDNRQINALVDYRQEQIAADAKRASELVPQSVSTGVGPVRAAIGEMLMRAGARIAGAGSEYRPHLLRGSER